MDDKEKLNQELQWVKYRMHILDIMEKKLLLMRNMAQETKIPGHNEAEIEELNRKINNLAGQVKALDDESKKIDGV
ncbi:hypothetical protein [Clostridium luticellarii]|uniref:Uncharacterized protein n=1 Tax=Clostridium luticellarii TaxID=1691940 RepID=A0A2T0B6V8_9CLOT|nr:hypothetical protein [Clostridium luticellarii]PRR79624.1 hypothetical protein CLLU_34680 [Clostridium luticellarii]